MAPVPLPIVGEGGAETPGRVGRHLVAVLAAFALLLAPGHVAAAASPPEITARGAVLWEPATDTVLYDREADRGRPMASTTKIMTVLLGLEADSPDAQVSVSARAAEVGGTPGGANLGLRAGDRLRMGTLLAGLMLRSGNDAAVAVAEHVAGDEESFVELMNERADELGLEATNFVNSSGLTDDPDHRASPLDLARLAEVAMAHDEFAAWAAASTFDAGSLGTLPTRNELLDAFPGATGVKTGFTSLAGLCLVASATRDGRTLYAVVLGSDDSFADAAALLTHGFDDHRLIEAAADIPVAEYRWADVSVELRPSEPVALTVASGAAVLRRVQPSPRLERPMEAGAEAGQALVLVDGRVVASSALELAQDVPPRSGFGPDELAGAAVHDGLHGLLRLRPMDHDL